MPWHIGIDEAGYGPNLGPFVMTLVACQVPEESLALSLWELLKSCTRRAEEKADHRLVVADSKQVYSTSSGWEALEKTVLSAHASRSCARADTLQALLDSMAADELPVLRAEAWFEGTTPLPTEVNAEELSASTNAWRDSCTTASVAWGFCQSAIVATPRFNDLIDRWDSKGAVLSVCLARLLQQCRQQTPAEALHVVIDKHGGRNQYGALLQEAFPDGFVLAQEEGRQRSRYRVEGLDRPVQITFMPKADVEHFTVALASMFSKYLRELLMREFNGFWQKHLPGLKPTAGYPVDALRYYEAIRPVMDRLGLQPRQVWRSR